MRRLASLRPRFPAARTFADAESLLDDPTTANFVTVAFLAVTGWSGNRASPIAGLLGAIETVGFCGLLILSLRTATPSAPAERSSATASQGRPTSRPRWRWH